MKIEFFEEPEGILMVWFFKKKEAPAKSACCDVDVSAGAMNLAEVLKCQGARVKVLGSGCKKCNDLEANVLAALGELGWDLKVDHVSDFAQIAAYGVMTTPALVLDGKVVSYGKVLSCEEVVSILNK